MDNEINIPPMGTASLLGFPAYARVSHAASMKRSITSLYAVDVVDVDGEIALPAKSI